MYGSTQGGPKFLPRRGLKSRLLQFKSNKGYVLSYHAVGQIIFAYIFDFRTLFKLEMGWFVNQNSVYLFSISILEYVSTSV